MGMPRRVRSEATFDGVHKLRTLSGGCNPVEAPMRVICPMPWGILEAANSGSKLPPLMSEVLHRQP